MSGYGSAGPNANTELSNKFVIEINGIRLMAFEKCTLPDMEWAQGDNRTGIDPLYKQRYSGLRNNLSISLEKTLREGGVPDIKEFFDWYKGASKDKRDGAVVHMDRDGEELMRYEFSGAWLSKCKMPEFDANSDDGKAVFVIDLTIDNLELQ